MFLSSAAWSVGREGNGGVGIYCPSPVNGNKDLNGYMFYDFYEAIDKYKVNPVAPKGSTVYEKVNDLIERVQAKDFGRAKKYKNWLNSFKEEAVILPNTVLPDSKDMDLARYDVSCHVIQAILQTTPILPGDSRYTINGDFWSRLSPEQQAYGIMHEIIYREALGLKHSTSRFVRYFLAMIIGDKLKTLSRKNYIHLLERYKNGAFRPEDTEGELQYEGLIFERPDLIKWKNGKVDSYNGPLRFYSERPDESRSSNGHEYKVKREFDGSLMIRSIRQEVNIYSKVMNDGDVIDLEFVDMKYDFEKQRLTLYKEPLTLFGIQAYGHIGLRYRGVFFESEKTSLSISMDEREDVLSFIDKYSLKAAYVLFGSSPILKVHSRFSNNLPKFVELGQSKGYWNFAELDGPAKFRENGQDRKSVV